MNLKYLFYAFVSCVLFISCKTDEPNAKFIENDKVFVASIDIDAVFNDEFEIIDLDKSSSTRSIKLFREGNKFVSRFVGAAGTNVPILIELKGPEGRWVGNTNAKVSTDKKLKISAKDIPFAPISTQSAGTEWYARFFIGGTYNQVAKRLDFEGVGLIKDESEWTNFSSYVGKVPFVSPFEKINVGSSLDITFKEKNKVTTISPTGNILRLLFYNPDATLTNKSQNISKVKFESNDLVSKGGITLGRDEHNWRSLSGGAQVVEYVVRKAHNYVPVQPRQYATFYLWVDSTGAWDAYTKIYIDYTKDHYQGYNHLVFDKDYSATINQGKSARIFINLPV